VSRHYTNCGPPFHSIGIPDLRFLQEGLDSITRPVQDTPCPWLEPLKTAVEGREGICFASRRKTLVLRYHCPTSGHWSSIHFVSLILIFRIR